jgi:hypothetical protein
MVRALWAVKCSRSRAIRAGTKPSAYSCAWLCSSEAPAAPPSLTIRCTYAASACAATRARQPSVACPSCSVSSSDIEAAWRGAWTITSCAPSAGDAAK